MNFQSLIEIQTKSYELSHYKVRSLLCFLKITSLGRETHEMIGEKKFRLSFIQENSKNGLIFLNTIKLGKETLKKH
jgi:hypothetical protein